MRNLLRRRTEPRRPDWVRVAFAGHQPEADMLIGMLENEGIRAFSRRPVGADVPEMGASGPREILVGAADALRAHALIDPLPSDANERLRP